MERHYHDLNANFCQNLFMQHSVLAYKFDNPLGNMEGISSCKIWSLVAIFNSDPYICRISRRDPSCVLEALQVGKPYKRFKFAPFYGNLCSYVLR